MKLAQIQRDAFDSYHFGFVIGPRLNAAGRIDHALNGVRLFTSNNNKNVSDLALKLHSLNVKRQDLTENMLKESLKDAEEQVKRGEKLLFVARENWAEGIVGLIAGRLNERFYLPVLAAAINSDNVKGSARSVPGFDITKAISQNEKILKKFGGHNQAAGFSLDPENLEQFILNMQKEAKINLTEEMLLKELKVDMELIGENITPEFLEKVLTKFKPFGFGNNEPVFAIRNVSIYTAPILMGAKGQHVKFSVKTIDDTIFEVVAFNKSDKFFDIINLKKKYDLAGVLGINEWRGNKVMQLKLKELIQLD